MTATNFDSWLDLFHKQRINPRQITILQTIEVGYNSTVYLLSLDGMEYAVKIYAERFNGTDVCLHERRQTQKAWKSIPNAVPQVYFYSTHTENGFHREILVMERVFGVPLTRDVFNERVFDEMVKVLKRLHRTDARMSSTFDEHARLVHCREVLLQFLQEDAVLAPERVANHFDALEQYYLEREEIFRRPRTIVHGDLWWDNILVDNGRIRLIDWLESSEQQYCRDLAQFKIGVLNEVLDAQASQHFFEKILNVYRDEFDDKTIFKRIRYYLPVMFLEEAFYLPFTFFPWEIKYRENADAFRRRFIDYFERAEAFFKHEQEPS
jgi:aminoglycoside phosphotransferase (APT) family kinase protein